MRLENWYIVEIKSGYQVAYGNVYGNDRFEDGSDIRTSVIMEFGEDMKYIKTMNSVYELGTPLHGRK